MTVKSQLDYRNWRCPGCGEVVSTLAQRDTLPCPRCREVMLPAEPGVSVARGSGSNGNGASNQKLRQEER